MKKLAARLALVMGALGVTLLLLELLVRLFAPQQLILIRSDIWIPAERIGWMKAPNIDTQVNTGERNVRLITDEHGDRVGASLQPDDPAHRILVQGDSIVEALQVEYEDSMVGLLETGLSEELGEPVQISNAAVGGWGPSQYLLSTQDRLQHDDYDMVVVFLFLGNDVEPQRIDYFGPRAPTLRHSLRLPRSFSRTEIINAVLYPINDFLEVRSHLYILLRNRLDALLAQLGLSARQFPAVVNLSEADSTRWAITADICADIAREGATDDIPVLFVLLPSVYQIDRGVSDEFAAAFDIDTATIDLDQPSRLLSQELEARGLEVIDTSEAFSEAWASGVEDLYGKVDTHLGPAGHQLVVETVLPTIRAHLAE